MDQPIEELGTSQPFNRDAEREQLMADAEASDNPSSQQQAEQAASAEPAARGDRPETEPRATEPSTEQQTPDSPETSAETKARARDASGKFVKQEGQPEPEKPESNYAKARKDSERYERNWQKLNTDQAELRRQQQELQAHVQQIRQQPQQSQQPRFSSEHLVQAANEFRAQGEKLVSEGDTDGARAQFDLAKKAEQAATESYQAEQTEAYQSAYSQHAQAWRANAQAVIDKEPTLGDPQSELAKQMLELLEREPVFGQLPDGFKKAYDYLTMYRSAAEASGLREENTKLKQENERLTKLTTPEGRGDTAKHGARTSISDLSLDKQREALAREAELEDAA